MFVHVAPDMHRNHGSQRKTAKRKIILVQFSASDELSAPVRLGTLCCFLPRTSFLRPSGQNVAAAELQGSDLDVEMGDKEETFQRFQSMKIPYRAASIPYRAAR